MTQPSFPNTQPSDSEAVTTALETAEALWNRGDPNEALRWLRRAAEAAGDSGDDTRAVALAKAVADLNSSSGEKPRLVKPPPLPPKAPPSKLPAAEAEAADKDGGRIDTVNETPSKNAAAAEGKAPVRVSKPPPAPSSRAGGSKAPTVVPAKTSSPSTSKAPEARPSTAAVPQKNFARAALRVYVSTQEQDGDKLDVHVLSAGQHTPAGAIEAMLVPLRKGAKLIR